MPVARLGPRDLDRALAVVAEAASAQGAQPFELPVIECLLDLIPGDRGGYFEFRKPRSDIFKVEIAAPNIDWTSPEIRLLVRNWWPLRDYDWTRDAEETGVWTGQISMSGMRGTPSVSAICSRRGSGCATPGTWK